MCQRHWYAYWIAAQRRQFTWIANAKFTTPWNGKSRSGQKSGRGKLQSFKCMIRKRDTIEWILCWIWTGRGTWTENSGENSRRTQWHCTSPTRNAVFNTIRRTVIGHFNGYTINISIVNHNSSSIDHHNGTNTTTDTIHKQIDWVIASFF